MLHTLFAVGVKAIKCSLTEKVVFEPSDWLRFVCAELFACSPCAFKAFCAHVKNMHVRFTSYYIYSEVINPWCTLTLALGKHGYLFNQGHGQIYIYILKLFGFFLFFS